MLSQIKTWLASSDRKYNDGVKLYLKSRHEASFDNFFQSVQDADSKSQHYKMLEKKLSNIARILETNSRIPVKAITAIKVDTAKANPITVDPIKITKTNKQIPAIDSNPFIRVEYLPENLQADYKEIQKITPELHAWHEKAKAAKTDEARKIAINTAAELEEKRDLLWNGINVWWLENNGESTSEENKAAIQGKVDEFNAKYSPAAKAALEAIGLSERIADLKTNISRAEKEKSTLKDPKKIAKRDKSIADWKKEQKLKEARLKEITTPA